MTHSGFAEAYREYYGLDPEKEIEKLAQEGKVIAKEEAGGILIYLPQDVAGSHQENKLPNSLGSTDLKDTTVRTASAPKKIDGNSESAKDNIKPDNSKLLDILSPVHQPPVAVDASQYPAARYCLSCGAKLINFTGVKRCSYCGAPVEAIENAREALIDPFASESIPTQSILTNTNEHTTESFPHYLIWVNIGIWLFFSYLHSKFSYDLRFPPANYFLFGLGSTISLNILPGMVALVGKLAFRQKFSRMFSRCFAWIVPLLGFLLSYGMYLESLELK